LTLEKLYPQTIVGSDKHPGIFMLEIKEQREFHKTRNLGHALAAAF